MGRTATSPAVGTNTMRISGFTGIALVMFVLFMHAEGHSILHMQYVDVYIGFTEVHMQLY